MKIAIVTPWFPTEGRPHDGAFMEDHVEVARRLGDVRIFHVPEVGIQLKGQPLDQDARTFHASPPLPSAVAHLAQALRAAAAIRRWRPDVIHVHTFEAGTASVLGRGRARLVVTEHHSSVLRESLTRRQRGKAAFTYRRAHGITAVSQPLALRIADDFGVALPTILPNPVNIDRLAMSERDGPRSGIAFVGRLEPVKGLDVLLRAVALLEPGSQALPLIVVGDGTQAASLRELAHDLGIADHVRWLGAQTRDRAVEIMREARCVAVPSRIETFGVVAVEAMAVGTPVVGSDVGALGSLLRGAGLPAVTPEDPDALAEALRQVGDSALPTRQHLRAAVDRFSHDAVEAQLRELYSLP